MIVAIHQPNFLPWLGYFNKIARADRFVFLERAQYSKGSYTNRVRILEQGAPAWLTQPLSKAFGKPIGDIEIADSEWPQKHLSRLRNAYGRAAAFSDVWQDLSEIYSSVPRGPLAGANRHMISAVSGRLGLSTDFVTDGELMAADLSGAERLVALLQACGTDVSYLSGRGGRNYQDEELFARANIPLLYVDYECPGYDQGTDEFMPGLSVLDSLFHLGWAGTAELIAA